MLLLERERRLDFFGIKNERKKTTIILPGGADAFLIVYILIFIKNKVGELYKKIDKTSNSKPVINMAKPASLYLLGASNIRIKPKANIVMLISTKVGI